MSARDGVWAGKVVLITGAAGGIGSALARRWAGEGAGLVLLDVDAGAMARLAAELAESGTARSPLAIPCDVTDEAACRAAVEAAVDRFGALDVVVANAGRTHLSAAAETGTSVLRRVMDLNFFGAVHVVRAALPVLRERRGRIVVMSSVAGFAPLVGRAGYAASKHALHGWFGSLRAELAHEGVSVTLVCPAFVRTRIGEAALGGDGGPAKEVRTETGRPLEADIVARSVVEGARRRRRLVVPGRTARMSWWLQRLAPGLYERIMTRRLARPETPGPRGK